MAGERSWLPTSKQGGDACPGQAHQPPAPFALEGRGGRAVFIGIPGKQYQIDLLGDGGIDNRIQRFQEIHHPHRQTGLRVMPAVVGHIDVCVGKMEDFRHTWLYCWITGVGGGSMPILQLLHCRDETRMDDQALLQVFDGGIGIARAR